MAVANPLKEKVQNLPLLCVETICKFTPTAKLVRLYSNTVPLPGAFWSYGLETILRKRLPFSLASDLPYHQADDQLAIFDSTGAKVASIKRPEAFRFCGFRELIGNVALAVRANALSRWRLYVLQGEAILKSLSEVTELSLLVCDAKERFEPKDLLAANLEHLLPRLESFVLKLDYGINQTFVEQTLVNFVHSLPFDEMTSLRRLHLPEDAFFLATQTIARDCAARGICTEFSSLGILHGCTRLESELADVRHFITTYCRQVSALHLIGGDFKEYLAAFRTLAGLNTLSLNEYRVTLDGLNYDGSQAINSVSDLRIICSRYTESTRMCRIASFFPKVQCVAIQQSAREILYTAWLLCRKQMFPAVQKLRCFLLGDLLHDESGHLRKFLAAPNLSESVDLSQICFSQLARVPSCVVDVCREMQGNSASILLLRGPVHRAAVSCLQSYVASNGENAQIASWKDRDMGGQPGILHLTEISEQTDLKIVGIKTSGSLKGEQFTIRVFHQLAKRVDILD